jgi:hypothetical protein
LCWRDVRAEPAAGPQHDDERGDSTADGVRPQRLDRLFECLEGVVRTCPECSKKKLPLDALIVHLNDAHHWTRERIAAWVADPDVPQDESHAHH